MKKSIPRHALLSETSIKAGQIVYESLRNSAVCASLGIAAVVALRFPDLALIGSAMTTYTVLVFLSAFLCMWNLAITLARMLDLLPHEVKKRHLMLFAIPLFVLFAANLLVFGALVKVQAQAIGKQPGQMHQAGQPAATVSSPPARP